MKQALIGSHSLNVCKSYYLSSKQRVFKAIRPLLQAGLLTQQTARLENCIQVQHKHGRAEQLFPYVHSWILILLSDCLLSVKKNWDSKKNTGRLELESGLAKMRSLDMTATRFRSMFAHFDIRVVPTGTISHQAPPTVKEYDNTRGHSHQEWLDDFPGPDDW